MLMLGTIVILILLFVVTVGVLIYKYNQKNHLKVFQDDTREEQEKLLQSFDISVDELKQSIEEEVVESMTRCSKKPPCEPGYVVKKNSYGEDCCYIDPKSTMASKDEVMRAMLKDISQELIITESTEFVIARIAKMVTPKTKQQLDAAEASGKVVHRFISPEKISKIKAVVKANVKLGLKKAGKVVGAAGSKALTKAGASALANSIKAAIKAQIKLVAKLLTKMYIRISVSIATKFAATAAVKATMGPIGWAMIVFDLTVAALDIYDPAGFNDFISNEIALNLRNITESSFGLMYMNEGRRFPALVPFDYTDDVPGTFAHKYVLPELKNRISDMVDDEMSLEVLETFGDDLVARVAFQEEQTEKALIEYMSTLDYEEEVCNLYAQKGTNKVLWVDGAGCTLNKTECSLFNQREARKSDKEGRMLGLWTKRYRVQTGGTNKKPKMSERNLTKEVCMLSPLSFAKEACTEGKGTWNDKEAMCDFSARYCNAKGLRTHVMRNGITNCVMFPGQKIMEMFLGSTITRSFGKLGDPETYKALLAGDLTTLKQWGMILAYLSTGPFGMALAIGKFIPGFDEWKDNAVKDIKNGIMDTGKGIGEGTVKASEFVVDVSKHLFKKSKETPQILEKEFVNVANKTFDEVENVWGKLLEKDVKKMIENFEKAGKISAKLGRDAALKTVKLGQSAIDKVEKLVSKLTSAVDLKKVKDGIDKGLNGIEDVFNEIGDFFKSIGEVF